MTNRYCFEVLDKSLRDVMVHSDEPFDVVVIVFSGRGIEKQLLPVTPGGSRHDIVSVAICSTMIWMHVELFGRQITRDECK